MIQFNGKAIEDFDGRALTELLSANRYKTALIAVEYNGAILPKDQYDKTILKDGDTLEVVSFVGGG